ncbi:GNAT family N-acetyltransferase [Neolewinella agarilytica]|uniref:Ribosomal protein S18 acetylase RimI n=1 Tax=Neolewinella agarilytica TaxID=478744 RepID=A0A1H9FS65_9BACT|nr:GNAT family N-acetyltransferase [Neolewinella agarilytica]SEQ40775.1 Ribosomal protein S18 acetylase RimI [Neolewinella agarilytica]
MPDQLSLRHANPADVAGIANLHAQSWQLTYRGTFSDDYLDHEAPAERLATWTERFATPNPEMLVTVAEKEGSIVGFYCTFLHYSEDGHMLDNLHVRPGLQGHGIGPKLMRDAAERVSQHDPDGTIFLWVLTDNEGAIRFYERHGGRRGRTQQLVLAGNKVEAIMMSWPVKKLLELR